MNGLALPPALLRVAVRQLGRRALDPSLAWDVQRERLEAFLASSPAPRGTTVVERVLNGVRAEVISAGSAHPRCTIVHFHGGGYCLGSPRMVRTWAARLSARTSCEVVLPDYRLAPEHPYPAALEDARAVMKAVLGDFAADTVVVSGDSAGGGLALALVLAMRDAGEKLPAGCMLLSAWLDLSTDRGAFPGLVRKDVVLSPGWLEACAAAYAGQIGLTDPAVSPLLAEHGGLPRLLIQAGADELLAPDAERLAASASASEVDVTYTRWPRMWHDFELQPGMLAAADSALSQAAWFVGRVTSYPASLPNLWLSDGVI
jgi:epsilon-lactone hydrolase